MATAPALAANAQLQYDTLKLRRRIFDAIIGNYNPLAQQVCRSEETWHSKTPKARVGAIHKYLIRRGMVDYSRGLEELQKDKNARIVETAEALESVLARQIDQHLVNQLQQPH